MEPALSKSVNRRQQSAEVRRAAKDLYVATQVVESVFLRMVRARSKPVLRPLVVTVANAATAMAVTIANALPMDPYPALNVIAFGKVFPAVWIVPPHQWTSSALKKS